MNIRHCFVGGSPERVSLLNGILWRRNKLGVVCRRIHAHFLLACRLRKESRKPH